MGTAHHRELEIYGEFTTRAVVFGNQVDRESPDYYFGASDHRSGKLTNAYRVTLVTTEEAARKEVHKYWPNAGVGGDLMTDLPLPSRFEPMVELMDPKKITEGMPLGSDPKKHLEGINEFVDAGFDHVYVHQVGPTQDQFFRFYAEEVIPKLGKSKTAGNGRRAEARQAH